MGRWGGGLAESHNSDELLLMDLLRKEPTKSVFRPVYCLFSL